MAQYQRLIHDYLDGSIEPYMEEMLFDELARDSSLRREFHEQMAIHRSASGDMASISTPGELSGEVFAALGISMAPSGHVRIPLTSRRSFKTFTSLFAGTFAIMLVYFLTAQPDGSPKVVKIAEKADVAPASTVKNGAQIAAVSEEHFLKENIFSEIAVNNSFKKLVSEPNHSADFKTEKSGGPGQQDFVQSFTGIFSVNALPANQYSLKRPDRQALASQSFPDFLSSLLKSYPLTFQVTSASPDFKDFKKANYTATVLYDITPSDKIGFEAGYENFQQNFTQSVNGVLLRETRLTPNPTFGIVYRRLAPEFSPFKSIVPFAQAYVGVATNSGITQIVKGAAGISVRPTDRTQFNIGYEIAPSLSSKYESRTQFIAGFGFGF